MAIDLRNKQSINNSTKDNNFSKDKKTDNIDNKVANNITYKFIQSNTILYLYNIIFLAIISFFFISDWNSVWQLPKSVAFIFGVTGFLVIASIFWIFGLIKNTIKITLGDLIFIILGVSIVFVSFLNPNQIAFWGSSSRIFDSGLFIGFLLLFYILNKLFLDNTLLKFTIIFLSNIILVSGFFTVIAIYFPNLINYLPIISKLQPTSSFLTESSQELVFLTLLSISILSIYLFNFSKNKISNLVFKILFYIGVLINIMLVIRLPGYNMYILTVLTLIFHSINYINQLNKNNNSNQFNIKLVANRISFIYGILIIFLLALMVIKPFQNNQKFPEYKVLTLPSIESSFNVTKQVLQKDFLLGSGNIMYAWNKFSPINNGEQFSNFSFETLYSEIFNIIVKNGIIVGVILLCFSIWILGSIFRVLFIQKVFPLEIYPLILCIIGIFLIPFTVITKVIFILILGLWTNVFTKYFRPLIKFDFDINKIPASVSSLFTFLILFSIAISVFASTKIFNLMQAQQNILKASEIRDNLSQQIELLNKAQNIAPNYIEYANFYIPILNQQIDQQIRELSLLSQQKNDDKNTVSEKQKNIENDIAKVQELIDKYKNNFSTDTRVIYWQIELYLKANQYTNIKESDYLSNIARGKELQPKSLYWDLYEAQYYIIQAQKDKEINIEEVNKAKNVLNSILEKNIYFIEAYQNYYDLLNLNKEYTEQINILNKYISSVIDKNLIADQNLVYNLALAYQNNKQYNESISYYNKLLESFPNYTNVYFNLGEIYEAQKKNDLAIQKYQKVLELDSNAEIARKKIEQLK
jgi:tetratricopeptide (TPR) repeat protein